MKKAQVTADWITSVHNDVVSQRLSVTADGELVVSEVLGPDVDEFELPGLYGEGVVLAGTIEAVDGAGNTGTAHFPSWAIPDLTAPAPPTGLGFRYNVVDVPDEVPTPPVEEPVAPVEG